MRTVVLLPKVYEELDWGYALADNISHDLNTSMKEAFCPGNRGLLFREDKDKIRIYSETHALICERAEEGNSLKAIALREIPPHQYQFAIQKGDVLDGDWQFISSDVARSLYRKEYVSSTDSPSLDEEIERKSVSGLSLEGKKEFREYAKYWEKHDVAKQYEKEALLTVKKASLSEYTFSSVDYDMNLIKLNLSKSDFVFRTGERVELLGKDGWASKNMVTQSDMNIISGFVLGNVKKYNPSAKVLVVESSDDKIKTFMEDKSLRQGMLWNSDIGSRSKLNRETQALTKLFKNETANKNLKAFVPNIQALPVFQGEQVNEKLFSEDYYKLKGNQQNAIKGALGCSDIYLIQGPPGTGKTTVISEIIKYITKDNKKVLLSSQTNLAVDNVLQRIGHVEGVNAIRIGSEEKFELGSEEFALENRVLHLQAKICTSIEERIESMEALRSEIQGVQLLLQAHELMEQQIRSILNVRMNYENSHKEVLSLQYEKDLLQKELVEFQNALNLVQTKTWNKESFTKILVRQEKSSYSLDENITTYKLSQKIRFSPEEKRVISTYAEIIEEIHSLQQKRDLEDEKIKNYLGDYRECEKKLVQAKALVQHLQSQEEGSSTYVRQAIQAKIQEQEVIWESLNLELKDCQYRIYEANQRKSEYAASGDSLVQSALKSKKQIEDYIREYEQVWKELLGVEVLTKGQFLDVYNKVQDFDHNFSGIGSEIHLICELDSYKKYLSNLKKKEELTKRHEDLERLILSKGKLEQKLLDKLKEYSDDKLIQLYMSQYNTQLHQLEFDVEQERCHSFSELYREKRENLALYESTMDLQHEWAERLRFYHESFEDLYIATSNLICATCLGISSARNNYFHESEFDYVIIDEAARASSSELLIPLTKGKKIVLVGDHKQISPELEKNILDRLEADGVVEKTEVDEIYRKSLFGLMYEDAPEQIKTFLNVQFRMSAGISEVVSKCYYQSSIADGDNIPSKSHGMERSLRDSFYWLSTENKEDFMEKDENKSFYNPGEINTTLTVLKWIDQNTKGKKSVGVISPYKPHSNRTHDLINPADYPNLDIEVNTIDAFQGREKNIIIMNLVRNNDMSRIGHIGKDSRMNVALSRAQELLIFIGNKSFVTKNKHKMMKVFNILNHLERKNCVLNEKFFAL